MPFWATHTPGSDRTQRTVPAATHGPFGHWSNDPLEAWPGVTAATIRTAANDRRRTHANRPCGTFTPLLRAVPVPVPSNEPTAGRRHSAARPPPPQPPPAPPPPTAQPIIDNRNVTS